MAAAINHMLIFSHSSAPFEWVIFSMRNIGYYFFFYLGLRPAQHETMRGFESERWGMRAGGELFLSAHTAHASQACCLLLRVVGVKTG